MNTKEETINSNTNINLTPEQSRAVYSDSHHIAIIAGAGSGKTRVLTERICHLIQDNIAKPEQILAVTFTSKATQEMKKRIVQNIGDKATGIWIRTYHSYGLQLLRTYPKFAGLSENFEIVNFSTKKLYIKSILKQYNSLLNDVEALSIITRIKNTNTTPSLEFKPIFDCYNQKLRDNNLIDLEDMVWLPVQMLQKELILKEAIQERFTHILIDEYQDTNDIQNKLIELSSGANCNICIVGDDDQCVYEWRGSKPQYIKDFVNQKDVERIYLSENFRSQKHIVNIANHFIAHNTSRIEKKMLPHLDSEIKPEYHKFSTDKEEARFIAETIKKLVGSMYKYNDMAILVRSATQALDIFEVLHEYKIPYSNRKTETSTEFAEALRVLHAILNTKSNNNISRAINFPNSVLDNFTYMDLAEQYNLENMPLICAFEKICENDSIVWDNRDIFKSRFNLIKKLSNVVKSTSDNKATEILYELFDYYSNESCGKDEKKIKYISQMLSIAKEWELDNEQADFQSFVDYIVFTIENDDGVFEDYNDDSVTIMTCHRSKGLEFPVVFIPCVQVGKFPNDFFIKTTEELEQERRLFYVAMTRASERLYITCSANALSSNVNSVIKKGFISEIPQLSLWRADRKSTNNFDEEGDMNV